MGLVRLLLRFLRVDRPLIINALELYIFCLFRKFVSAWIEAFGFHTKADIVQEIFVVGSGLIMVHLTGLVLFRLRLQLESSIKSRDWIAVGGVSGRISEIRWRYTAVETRDGETVIFPNSVLMKNPFTIVSSPTQPRHEWRRWIWFNVPRSIPPGKVVETAVEALT